MKQRIKLIKKIFLIRYNNTMNKYHSPKKLILFWLLIISIVLALWLLWLGIDSYLLTRDPLSHIESSKAIAMAIIAILLIVVMLAGLIISTMLGNKRYSRYFGVAIGVAFASLLAFRSIFG